MPLSWAASSVDSRPPRAIPWTWCCIDDGPPGLAFRIFRDGKVLMQRDAAALAARKARAALDYFDWQPVKALFDSRR